MIKKVSFYLFLFTSLLALFGISEASAAVSDTTTTASAGAMGTVLCNVLAFVTGTVGRTIATFTIIGIGVGFFTGKVNWGVLIGVMLGIAVLFGAPAIIRTIAGGEILCED
ncbi:MAG TPA: TrbC/VirB2 family protein [Rickettsiales bacterium]|nr:TrbC/VirB2 family protein [Rickettsiales bacterium]